MQTSLLALQNGADRRDTGVATSSAFLSRMLGSTLGVAVCSAALQSQLPDGPATAVGYADALPAVYYAALPVTVVMLVLALRLPQLALREERALRLRSARGRAGRTHRLGVRIPSCIDARWRSCPSSRWPRSRCPRPARPPARRSRAAPTVSGPVTGGKGEISLVTTSFDLARRARVMSPRSTSSKATRPSTRRRSRSETTDAGRSRRPARSPTRRGWSCTAPRTKPTSTAPSTSSG